MSCEIDYSSLCVDVTSSNCVIWNGDDIACLGITKGMSLTNLENLVATKLCKVVTDIDLSTVVISGDFIALLGTKDKSIANLFQILLDNDTTLKGLINTIQTTVDNLDNITIDFKCVTGPPSQTTITEAIQALVNYICALNTQITATNNSSVHQIYLNSGYLLKSAINTCQPNRILKYGDAETTGIQFRGFMAQKMAGLYFGPLEFFDASGKGLDGTPMCGYYICNGNWGTPDMRGRTGIGAVAGIPGGALNSQVDPLQNDGLGNYGRWDFGGAMRHKLILAETPSHEHDPQADPHVHQYFDTYVNPTNGGPIGDGWASNHTKAYIYETRNTDPANVNITESTRGGDGYHPNMMPYIAGVWIMMID